MSPTRPALLGLLMLAATLAGCAKDPAKYDAPLFALGSGFSAKSVCSCIFVTGRDEAFCRDQARVSPDVARFKVDHDQKLVTSKVLGGWKQQARYVDDQLGCVMQ
ncbi:MAG: hypothetical protein H6742_18220 [Alphaproteobacteria bacterium]|nr:hypothetical protein [Alphaproteobacteria bacterium]